MYNTIYNVTKVLCTISYTPCSTILYHIICTIEEMFKTYNCGIGMVVILDKNFQNINSDIELIPLGKVIKSDTPSILYKNFASQFQKEEN